MRDLGDDAGSGTVDVDDPWGSMPPHSDEDHGGIPATVERALSGDVRVDGMLICRFEVLRFVLCLSSVCCFFKVLIFFEVFQLFDGAVVLEMLSFC